MPLEPKNELTLVFYMHENEIWRSSTVHRLEQILEQRADQTVCMNMTFLRSSLVYR